MNKISICIPTYKRPLMLKKLLLSIMECNIDNSIIGDINIILVDNDSDRSAEIIANEINKEINASFDLNYYNYPHKGLSNVRNYLIKKAFFLNSDYLVFIDDDEYVTRNWLNELVKSIIKNECDAVMGPVIAVLGKSVPKYISFWFERDNFPDNSHLSFLWTGNLIIKKASLLEFDVWFDQHFNHSGSEDSFFGYQLLKKGAKIYWASKAIAFETIPTERSNLQWLIKRFYRGGGTNAYKLKLEKEYLKLLKKLIVSILYTIIGFSSIILVLFPLKIKYWGILKVSEGIGGLTGFFNIIYQEYE